MPSKTNEKPVPTPDGFEPSDQDVVIGKGKKFYHHAGNKTLRDIVASNMHAYESAATKPDKSSIITMVVNQVRQAGSFVRKDLSTGKWLFAEDLLCREKCSQSFRDCLHGSYRSSNMAKKKKRIRELERQQQAVAELEGVHQAKRMRRLDPIQVAPAPIGLHLFDWELPPRPPASRRASGLIGPMMSALMDSFVDAEMAFEGESPFEPMPLPPIPLTSSYQPPMVKEEPAVVIFDPKMIMSDNAQFRRRNSIFMSDDISAMSASEMRLDDRFRLQQYQDTRQTMRRQEGQNRNPNISAAFAA